MPAIVPNHLLYVKLFEGLDFFVDQDGGRRHLSKLSRPSLQIQVDDWVKQTSNLIQTPGPLALTTTQVELPAGLVADALGDPPPVPAMTPVVVIAEVRTFSVTYIPAVR